MRILVLGGYGVFGGRLVQLLLRDRHEVWVTGRSLQKAQRFTERHQGIPLQLDRCGDLSPILNVRPDVVVDASGPFQAYGDAALRVPEFCLDHGISYLDLSDDAPFTARIGELDAKAKAAGCFALSGASSLPATSASVVAALSAGLETIHVIETAIMPGRREAALSSRAFSRSSERRFAYGAAGDGARCGAGAIPGPMRWRTARSARRAWSMSRTCSCFRDASHPARWSPEQGPNYGS